MEWVEVRGKSVELAVSAALEELGLESEEQAEIKVLQEPERGFLGMGGRDAIVQVKAKPKKRRRRGRGSGKQPAGKTEKPGDQRDGRSGREPSAAKESSKPQGQSRPAKQGGRKPKASEEASSSSQQEPSVSHEEQATVVEEFLSGLLDAFGLDGTVTTSVDGDIVKAEVNGEQTEALVGAKGVIMQSIHELTRTVVQRRTRENIRLRLDIAGYAERRREALAIYAGRLAEQVIDDKNEIMLEPMNPADRKVIHDAVQAIDGVRSFSEGEEPRRSVIIAPAD